MENRKLIISLNSEQLKQVKDSPKQTVGDLLESIQEEIKHYKNDLGLDASKIPVEMQLVDSEGNIVFGRVDLTVGWIEHGGFVLTGNIEEIYDGNLSSSQQERTKK